MINPVSKLLPHRLSRRERQIMDVLYQRGEATVAEVQSALPDPPGYSAVRRLMAILEEKGHATHSELNGRYVYSPAESWNSVSKSALEQVVETFFGGSIEKAVSTLLSSQKARPSDQDLQRLEEMIRNAREEETLRESLHTADGQSIDDAVGCGDNRKRDSNDDRKEDWSDYKEDGR